MPTVSANLAHAILLALEEHRVLHKKWVDVTMRLYSLGAHQAASFHYDVHVDLFLRTLERERLGNLTPFAPEDPDSFVLQHQAGLSRYWLLSTYEALRTAQVKQGRAHERLTKLFRKVEMVRVPLAKLQIANDQKLDPAARFERRGPGADPEPIPYVRSEHQPRMAVCPATGSIGWYPFDVKTSTESLITRQMVSNELLALFD